MYGAIIGDIVGSRFERHNKKTKEFELFSDRSHFTDDSAMTIAVAEALVESKKDPEEFSRILPTVMRRIGFKYFNAGYGRSFKRWIIQDDQGPYGSYGNGSAMRVSPCGLVADSLEEALDLAKRSAEVTHNHPEGIKGAQAVVAAIFLAKTGCSKDEIKAYIVDRFYPLDETIDEIRPGYEFDVSCQGSVPVAIEAFLESESFEDTIRTAISVGGDSDTIGAMAGSIAWSYYLYQNKGVPSFDMDLMQARAEYRLPDELKEIIKRFTDTFK